MLAFAVVPSAACEWGETHSFYSEKREVLSIAGTMKNCPVTASKLVVVDVRKAVAEGSRTVGALIGVGAGDVSFGRYAIEIPIPPGTEFKVWRSLRDASEIFDEIEMSPDEFRDAVQYYRDLFDEALNTKP